MTTNEHEEITELVRVAIREICEPIDLLDRNADTIDKVYVNLQAVSQACAPAMRVQQLKRLCEVIESKMFGKVTGWLTQECLQEIQGVRLAFENVQRANTAYMDCVRPYLGVGGYVKSVQDFTSAPWSLVATFFGGTDFQRERDKTLNSTFDAWSAFGEACPAFMLSVESAISRRTGQHFAFNTPP